MTRYVGSSGLSWRVVQMKVKALKSAILMMLGGEPIPRILMTVIRFCINTEHHEFKKLLMLFWEIVPKYDSEKKLLPEMILVCNALRNDLNHSNEYVRGSMLRFLCVSWENPKLSNRLFRQSKLVWIIGTRMSAKMPHLQYTTFTSTMGQPWCRMAQT